MMSTLDAVFAVQCASRQEVNQSGSVGAIVKAAVDIAGPVIAHPCVGVTHQ